jgi:hypothetical protein
MMTPLQDPNFPPHPLDGSLKQYFRSQVPSPWPACRALDAGPRPVPSTLRAKSNGTSGRAILALAAALLLGLGVFLSSGWPNNATPGPQTNPDSLHNVTADGTNLLPPPKKVGPVGDGDLPLN